MDPKALSIGLSSFSTLLKNAKYVTFYYIPVVVSPVISSNNLTVELDRYIATLHLAYRANKILRVASYAKATKAVATSALGGLGLYFGYKAFKNKSTGESFEFPRKYAISEAKDYKPTSLEEVSVVATIGDYTIVAIPMPVVSGNMQSVLSSINRFKRIQRSNLVSYLKGLFSNEFPVVAARDLNIILSATEKDDIISNLEQVKKDIKKYNLSICVVDFATNSVSTVLSVDKGIAVYLTCPIHAAIDIRRTNLDLNSLANELSRTRIVTQGNASKVIQELLKRIS